MEVQRTRSRRRTWNFRVPLARLARHAVNLCGACAGCVTACTPGASAPLPEKAQSSEPKEITDLWHGEELLNDVIGRLWPSISEWFQRKLKAELEPQLKEQLMDIVEFEDIGLGTSPMRLEGITSSTSSEECGTDVFKTIRCAADLDYSGDGQITVGIRAGRGGAMGHVALTKLKLRGKIVVEFAHLTHLPPWFKCVRIYFPDMPEVDLTMDAKVFVLDAFCDTASMVKTRVLKVLQEAVASACVLPSRLVLEVASGIDHFRLHHPRPRGVLRTQIEVQAPPEEPQEESSYASYASLSASMSWLFESSSPKNLTSMQVSLGACRKNCASGDIVDFVVHDFDQQSVSVFANNSDTPLVVICLKDVIESGQGLKDPSEEEAHIFQLPLSFGSATGSLQMQWRQLAKEGLNPMHTLDQMVGDRTWTFGSPYASSWLLFIDLFHAVGLQGVEDETEIWAVVSVRRPFNAAICEQTSSAVPAASPARHGYQEWRYLGVLEHLAGVGGVNADDVERYVLGSIPEEAWRLLLGRALQQGSLPGGVDAVWKQPFCLLLDEDASSDAIRKLEVEIELRRPERGRSKSKSARYEKVGSATYPLSELISQPLAMEDLWVQICYGKKPTGHVRLRVQMRPLQSPYKPRMTGRGSLGSLGQRLQFLVRHGSGRLERPSFSSSISRSTPPPSPPDTQKKERLGSLAEGSVEVEKEDSIESL